MADCNPITKTKSKNQVWKEVLRDTPLSKLIKELKKTQEGLSTSKRSTKTKRLWRSAFSWRNFKHEHFKFPTALDQGPRPLCLIFALLGLFRFQAKLLSIKTQCLRTINPSLDYMLHVREAMPENDESLTDKYLMELETQHIIDTDEYEKHKASLDLATRRFTVKHGYINPTRRDGIESIKEAIEDVGGVLLLLVEFERNPRGRFVYDKDGKKVMREMPLLEEGEGEGKGKMKKGKEKGILEKGEGKGKGKMKKGKEKGILEKGEGKGKGKMQKGEEKGILEKGEGKGKGKMQKGKEKGILEKEKGKGKGKMEREEGKGKEEMEKGEEEMEKGEGKGEMERGKRKRKKKPEPEPEPEVRLMGHAVFAYGWASKKGKTSFPYMNSYGRKHKDEGHEVCRDIDAIYEVYTPQILFEEQGFRCLNTKAGAEEKASGDEAEKEDGVENVVELKPVNAIVDDLGEKEKEKAGAVEVLEKASGDEAEEKDGVESVVELKPVNAIADDLGEIVSGINSV